MSPDEIVVDDRRLAQAAAERGLTVASPAASCPMTFVPHTGEGVRDVFSFLGAKCAGMTSRVMSQLRIPAAP